MRQHIKDFFRFNKRERRGILALTSFIILLLILGEIIPKFIAPPNTNLALLEQLMSEAEVIPNTKKEKQVTKKTPFKSKKNRNRKTSLKIDRSILIDPNTASKEDLLKVGINEFAANNLIKFRESGRMFYDVDDLKSVYGIDTVLLADLNIQYPKRIAIQKEEKREVKTIEKIWVNINTGDSIELRKVRGIGEKLSSRIVRFRDKLGGFYSIDQLKDVYGIDSFNFEQIKSQVYTDSIVSTVCVNVDVIDSLKHPYLRYNLARALVNYRSMHGDFKNLDDLRKVKLITSGTLQKLTPYIRYN